jgi:uncharacterized protein
MNGVEIMAEMFEGRKIVLSSMVGSWAANLNTPASDEDWKHFVAPNFDDLYIGKMFASAKVSETLDYDVHDIRQLANLLWKANLNFISVVFGYKVSCVPELQWIFDNADIFASMNLPYLYNATMGMHFEKMSTLCKGTGNTQVLVEKYGYDTKQGTHAMRCLMVLHRISEGMSVRKALWFTGADRDLLISIKQGEFTEVAFRAMVAEWHETCKPRVAEWFKSCHANEEAKSMLDEGIKSFIRANL